MVTPRISPAATVRYGGCRRAATVRLGALGLPARGKRVGELVGYEVGADLTFSERRSPDHVPRDRRGSGPEHHDEHKQADAAAPRVLKSKAETRDHREEPEHLRLGGRVHPREDVGEAHDADGSRQREQRSARTACVEPARADSR